VGEELAPLIVMSSFAFDAHQRFETCLEGYLEGLAERGWKGHPLQVRFGVLVTIFYRYLFGAGLGELWVGLRDESNHKAIAAAFGLPDVGILCDLYAAQNQAYLNYYTEARQLLAQFS
jgi:hypothetical protein